jgi:glutamate dehydrogenase
LVFLGYADYRAAAGDSTRSHGSPAAVSAFSATPIIPRFGRCLAGIPGAVRELAKDPLPLILVKADARRRFIARPTSISSASSATTPAATSSVLRAFVGLYTAHVYHVTATEIPLLRRKIAAVRQAIGFLPRSHRDKTLLNVLETYPRDELIEIDHART